jgi:hypothetical protein
MISRWEENIKTVLQVLGYKDVRVIEIAEDQMQ